MLANTSYSAPQSRFRQINKDSCSSSDKQLYDRGWPYGRKALDKVNETVFKTIEDNIKDPTLKNILKDFFKNELWYTEWLSLQADSDLSGLEKFEDIPFKIKFEGKEADAIKQSHFDLFSKIKILGIRMESFEITEKDLKDFFNNISDKNDIFVLYFENCSFKVENKSVKEVFSFNSEIIQKFFSECKSLEGIGFYNLDAKAVREGKVNPEMLHLRRECYESYRKEQIEKEEEERALKKIFEKPESAPFVKAPPKAKEEMDLGILTSDASGEENKREVKQSKDETIPQAKKAEEVSYSPADAIKYFDKITSISEKVIRESLEKKMDEFVDRFIRLDLEDYSDEENLDKYLGLIDEYKKIAKNSDDVIAFIERPLKKKKILNEILKNKFLESCNEQGIKRPTFKEDIKNRYLICGDPDLYALVLEGCKKYYKEGFASEYLKNLIIETKYNSVLNTLSMIEPTFRSLHEMFMGQFLYVYIILNLDQDAETFAKGILSLIKRHKDLLKNTTVYFDNIMIRRPMPETINFMEDDIRSRTNSMLRDITPMLVVLNLKGTGEISKRTLDVFGFLKEKAKDMLNDKEWEAHENEIKEIINNPETVKDLAEKFWPGMEI